MISKNLLIAAVAGVFAANPAHAFSLFGSGNEANPAKVTADAETFAQAHAPWAQPFMRALYRDGEWGAVLNLNRLGLAAMEQRQFGVARKAFDEAITRVEQIYADDANAAKARSVFNAEKLKDFKGEPYERAMMYYYRGLLYLEEGDYQNARAAFLAADRHDTLSSAEEAAYAGTFGMMKYLAGWASSCDGDASRAEQLLQEARAVDPKLQALPTQPGHSLVLIDSGPAPVKWGDGQHRQILKFKAGAQEDTEPVLRTPLGVQVQDLTLIGDVTHQAMTRGGREVDGIMAGKARFKDGAGVMGDTALAVGRQVLSQAGLSGDRGLANLGLAGMLFGMVAKGVEKSAVPEADVRAWDNLPARVMVHVAKDRDQLPAQLVLPTGPAALPLQASKGTCSVAWGRTRPATLGLDLQGGSPASETNRAARNREFRAMLAADMSVSR